MSGFMSSLQAFLGSLPGKFSSVLDAIFPPEQRAKLLDKIKNFTISNPKFATFLAAQIVLTGFPLLLFISFSVTVSLFALIAGLLIGLLGAILFTAFMLGIALIVVLPTLVFTTFTATFIFLWGLGVYYILKWFNKGGSSAGQGAAISDKLNSLTGGRMSWLVDGVRKEDDGSTNMDQTANGHNSQENGHTNASTSGSDAGGNSTTTKSSPKSSPKKLNKTNGNTANATEPASTATADATNAASPAKTAASGATGAT